MIDRGQIAADDFDVVAARMMLAKWFSHIDQRRIIAVWLRFNGYTLREVGETLGIGIERARGLEISGLRKIREAARKHDGIRNYADAIGGTSAVSLPRIKKRRANLTVTRL